MRIREINEGPIDAIKKAGSAIKKAGKSFQRNVAKGFMATQKGGALGPDSAEKAIKNFFTNTGSDDTKTPTKKAEPTAKGTTAKQPTAKQPTAKTTASNDKSFPTGTINGKPYQLKKGDNVEYKNAMGRKKQATVNGMLQTRDKQGDLQVQLKLKSAVYAVDRQNIFSVNDKPWKFDPKTETGTVESKEDVMKNQVKEGLADLADMAERDHEVQMARADLYKIAKYAIKLHEMLKGVSEAEGLQGWQQAKITKAADYIGSVYHNLDYDMKFGEQVQEAKQGYCSDDCCGSDVKAKDCTCAPTCKHCDCNAVKEGKYKSDAQRKAVHASKANKDKYKESIAKKLEESLKKKLINEKAVSKDQQRAAGIALKHKKEGTKPQKGSASEEMMKMSTKELEKFAGTKHKGLPEKKKTDESVCSECGNPSYKTLDEEKQKGVDGKVCWKGYKRMGTKKKGGKTVDNCVKM